MNYSKKSNYLVFVIIFTILTVLSSVIVQYKRADLLDIAIYQKENFFNTSVLFVTFILIEIVSTYFMSIYSEKFAISDITILRNKIFQNYSRNNMSLNEKKKSSFINIMTQQLDMIKKDYIMKILLLAFLGLKASLIVILMFRVNVLLTAIVIVMLIIQVLVPKIFGKKLTFYNRKYIRSLESFTKKIEGFMKGYRLIYYLSAINIFNNSFKQSLDDLADANYSDVKYSNILQSFNELISYSTHFITIILCTYLLFIKTLDVKSAYLLIGFVEQLSYPLIGISTAYQKILSFKKTKNLIIKESVAPIGKKEKILFKDEEPIQQISLTDISINFEERKILTNFNKTFGKKKYLLMGKSGIGKTTILKLIHNEIMDYSGSIKLNGSDYKKTDVSIKIGLMDDTPIFINDTLKNNILLGKSLDDESLFEILNNVGLDYLKVRLNDEIDNENYDLSLGERKRIELARLLIRDYDVLLLDEPTPNIDNDSKKSIINLISKLKNKIIICSSHDNNEDFLSLFEEIIYLK